jgi:recombination protein RecA
VVRKKEKKAEPRRVEEVLRNLHAKNKDIYGSAMLMDDDLIKSVPTTPSGILSLDIILGGGYPQGRIVELYGPPGGGKTTTTLHALASVQNLGNVGAFVDAEHSLDTLYSKNLGVKVPDLLIYQPDCGEDALNLTVDLVAMLKPGDLIVVDSVAALIPRAELEGEVGDSPMGSQARMMSQTMRKLNGATSKSGATVLFINQTRDKIGVTFGSSETTSGGNALRFYASIRIDVRRTGAIKKGSDVIGNGTKYKTIKNKVYPPYRETETGIYFGRGVPRSLDVLTVASLVGVVEKSGAWYSYAGTRLGQGRENAAETLATEMPELLDELEAKVLECYNIQR